MDLAALEPPPSALEPDAPPPWAEPTGLFVEPALPQEGTAFGFIGAAFIPVVMALFSLVERNYGFTKLAVVVAVVLLAVGIFLQRRAKALMPAHRARFERSRRCWARVKSSKVKGDRKNRGAVTHYVLDLELDVWDSRAGESPHRSVPSSTPVKVEAAIPAALGPQVMAGAFFAVAFDPVERVAIPFTLLTRDGGQFPV